VDDEQHWLFDCDALVGIRQNHASTIERYPSLPELMAAVYDRSPAMAVLEYVFEATKFVRQWPSARLSGRRVDHVIIIILID
jgi:hypothetical protein